MKSVLSDAHVIVCRSLADDWIQALGDMRSRLAALYYVIDDDLQAAALDQTLPQHYRRRMARLVSSQHRLLPLANEIITCSSALQSRLASHHRPISVLPPALISPLPDLEHFCYPDLRRQDWRLGFHGTRAHIADLLQISPALSDLHQRYPSVSLDIMLGRFAPPELSVLDRVSTPEPLPWKAFLRYQRRQRIHIGLAPLWPTPFNSAKSIIKFLDIAVMGGVGIFSHREPYAPLVDDGKDGLLAEDCAEHWQHCVTRLVDYPRDAQAMAQAAADKARDVGDPTHTHRFWLQRQQGQ